MAFGLCLKVDQTGFDVGKDDTLLTALCLRSGTLEAGPPVRIQIHITWQGNALGERK